MRSQSEEASLGDGVQCTSPAPQSGHVTPIHHYYHVYADGAWHGPITEHVEALRSSGLAARAGFSFHVGMVGRTENVETVRRYLDTTDLSWSLIASAAAGWEQLTLSALTRDSRVKDGLVLYAHTKGAYSPSRFNTDWRQRMTHFNVIRWADAVASLAKCHAYGCHWINLDGNWVFAGNYWWTRMEHLRLMGPPTFENRWKAEEWIGHLPEYIPNFKAYDPAGPFPRKIGSPA